MKRIIVLLLVCVMLLSVGCSAAVSVVGANINEDGHLVLSMSDGSTIDAGYAKGEKGDKGDIGPQGPQGIQGPQGEVGPQGPKGERGPQGEKGEKGDTGAAGRDGRDGQDGTDGKDGTSPTEDFIYNDYGRGTILLAYVGSDKNVVVPEKTTEIDGEAFIHNRTIESVTLQNNVKVIHADAFAGCTSLKNVNIPHGIEIINSAFLGCSALESITIPASVKESDMAFASCSSLTAVTLCEGLESVGNAMFAHCSALKTLVVPSTCKSIDVPSGSPYIVTGFSDCDSLESISVLATNPPALQNGAFDDAANLLNIYVPSESVDAYKAADGWKDYADKIQAMS